MPFYQPGQMLLKRPRFDMTLLASVWFESETSQRIGHATTPFLHDLRSALLPPAGTRSQGMSSKGSKICSSTEMGLVFRVVISVLYDNVDSVL